MPRSTDAQCRKSRISLEPLRADLRQLVMSSAVVLDMSVANTGPSSRPGWKPLWRGEGDKHGGNNARLDQVRALQLEHEHRSADSQSNHLVAIDCERNRRCNGLAPERNVPELMSGRRIQRENMPG